MSPNPHHRRVSKRAAALRATDKVKADLEQFSQWEQKEKEVEDSKSAAMLNDERKPAAVPDPIDDFVQPPQDDPIEDFEGMPEDPADDSSSLNSDSVSTTSPCPSTTDESDTESSTDGSTDAITMTFSEMKRWEDEAIREQKATERRQHSGRDMFLSRRLSRKIRYSRRDEGRSPTLSPIVATALMFSPELAVYSRKYAQKSRNKMIKQTSRNKITKKTTRDNILLNNP
jgi:hypothetical protein